VSGWTFAPMSQAEAEAVAGWRYPGDYAFYDADSVEGGADELLDPAQRGDRLFTARGEDGGVEGFVELKPDPGGGVEIGLGLRPDLTGRGLGTAFTLAAVELARERRGARRVTLAVAAFNLRAITVYRRVGFVETGRHVRRLGGRDWEFLDMTLAAPGAG
jgi:[ribosomal protein S18]-alanine N-acetyltransferase